MSVDVVSQVHAVRKGVGAWIPSEYGFVRFSGPDAASWLQTQTSNEVLSLQSGQGHAAAILDRKAHLLAHFTLHRWQDEYWCIIETKQIPTFLAVLEEHHFLEDVVISDSTEEVEFVAVDGPRSGYFLASLIDTTDRIVSHLLPRDDFGCHPIEILDHQLLAFRWSSTSEDGYLLLAEKGHAAKLLSQLLDAGRGFSIVPADPVTQEVLRIESGIPRYEVDMDATNRLPETTLERRSVSYEKGCYVGQEVVAKLRTYGTVKRALMGLVFDEDCDLAPPFDSPILVGETCVGMVKSSAYSPTLLRPIALAHLDRDYRSPGLDLEFHTGHFDAEYRATVVILPFVQATPREERARQLYDAALEFFRKDALDQDSNAIDLLKEAVFLAPEYEDAYECLGVILNRHHRVDEAIHYMKILAELNPECVMAHTNLSVFYVAKGMIDEAEIEKSKAAVLQLQHARDARKAEDIAAAERGRIRAEALERMKMFAEVLDIDADDPLATFGMGSSHMQLGEYPEAIPYFERSAVLQKDYSAAYLNLGKCLEFIHRSEDAVAAYRKGIEAANRKGDLMPMREMERRMKSLLGEA